MKSLWIIPLSAAFALAAAAPAMADIPSDPCMGKLAGDACMTPMGKAGTCVDSAMGLTCQETMTTSTTGAGGAGGSAGTSGTTTTGGAGGSGGGNEEDSGCAYRPGANDAAGLAALGLLVGVSLLARRRRR